MHEIYHGDAACGAYLGTLSAETADVIVNDCTIVDDFDGARGTILLTLFTADTAAAAGLLRVGTFFIVAAHHDGFYSLWHDVDQLHGAGLCTQTAANAQMRLDGGNPIFHADGVVRADGSAVTDAKAAVIALCVAGIQGCSSLAATDATIVMLHGHIGFFSAAGNIGNLRHCFPEFKTSCFGNFLRGEGGTRDTKASVFGDTVGQCMGVSVTAGEAAGATVGTGQAIADCDKPLIFRDGHEFGSNDQHDTADQTNDGDCNDWNNDTHHNAPSFNQAGCR